MSRFSCLRVDFPVFGILNGLAEGENTVKAIINFENAPQLTVEARFTIASSNLSVGGHSNGVGSYYLEYALHPHFFPRSQLANQVLPIGSKLSISLSTGPSWRQPVGAYRQKQIRSVSFYVNGKFINEEAYYPYSLNGDTGTKLRVLPLFENTYNDRLTEAMLAIDSTSKMVRFIIFL